MASFKVMIMDNSTQPQGSKTIRIPCTEQQYNVLLKNRKYFKNYIAELCESYPCPSGSPGVN